MRDARAPTGELDKPAIPVDAPVVREPGLDREVLGGLQLPLCLGELSEFDARADDAQADLNRLPRCARERLDGLARVSRRRRREHTRGRVTGVYLRHR